MTRVNCIDPRWLRDDHMGAEYREISRIPALVSAAVERGETPSDRRNPTHYKMGAGHCRFFYPRLQYVIDRYAAIVAECRRRGRHVEYPEMHIPDNIPPEWFGTWQPDLADRKTNIHRLEMRGGLRGVYR